MFNKLFELTDSILRENRAPMFTWKEMKTTTSDKNDDFYQGNMNSKDFIDYLITKIKENKIDNFKVTSDANGTLTISYSFNTGCKNKNCKCEEVDDEDVYMGNDEENDLTVKFIGEDEFNETFKDLIDLRNKYIEKNNVKKNVVKINLGIDGKVFNIREITDEKNMRYFNLADISNLFSEMSSDIHMIIKNVATKLPNDLRTFKHDGDNKSIYVYVNYKFIIEIMKFIDVEQYFDICYDVWTNLIIEKNSDFGFEKLNVKNKFKYYYKFINMLKEDC